MFYVYILRTSSNTLYIGQTNNLEKRIKEHKNKSGKSAKYIRYFDSFELVYFENYKTRTEAMQREYQLKKLSKNKKEALIRGDKTKLKTIVTIHQIREPFKVKPLHNFFQPSISSIHFLSEPVSSPFGILSKALYLKVTVVCISVYKRKSPPTPNP